MLWMAFKRDHQLYNGGLLAVARGTSDFGAFLNMVAMSTYLYFLSEDVFHVSLFLACRVIGGLIASALGTSFFRRFTGRLSLVGFDLIRALAVLALLILPMSTHLFILPFIALTIGFAGAMFTIGLNSQLPHLVPSDSLIKVNAWLSSASAMGAVLGSFVSGVVIAMGSYELVFVVNMLIYLLAAGCVFCLTSVKHQSNQAQNAPVARGLNGLWLALKSTPVLAAMLCVTLADTLGSASHNVGFPIFAKLLNPADASTNMGALLATWALGKFVGANTCAKWLKQQADKGLEPLFFAGVACMSLGFITTFQQGQLLPALCFILFAGIGDGLAEVCLISRVQQEPDTLRLPLFSVLNLFQMTGFALGMLIVAPFYHWYQPGFVILLFHGIPLIMLFITGLVGYKIKRAISM